MNLSNFIARKYFLSKNVRLFVNFISGISMLGVCVATAALIIILSVFNGLNTLIRQQYHLYNPEIKVTPTKGKTFAYDQQLIQKLQSIKGIDIITEVIEDDAVFKYKEAQMIGKIKGVSDNFTKQSDLPKSIMYGKFLLHEKNSERASVGIGVAHTLSLNIRDIFRLEVWYPERKGKITMSEADIRREKIKATGIHSIELEHDMKYVIVPLSFTKKLMDYTTERSALEIQTKDHIAIDDIRDQIKNILGDQYLVKNRDQQQASILRALKIEKFFVYLVLTFVLIIASLNIFFSLSMLALEKKNDISVLLALGADRSFIKKVFLKEGAIITIIGAFSGLLLGGFIVFVQQVSGIVKMGMQTSIVDAYPVELGWSDFLITSVIIISIALSISYLPALRASQTDLKKHL